MDISKKLTGLIIVGVLAVWGIIASLVGQSPENQIALILIFGIWTMVVKN